MRGKKIKNRELIERENTEILLLPTATGGVICIKVFILLYRLKCKPKVTDSSAVSIHSSTAKFNINIESVVRIGRVIVFLVPHNYNFDITFFLPYVALLVGHHANLPSCPQLRSIPCHPHMVIRFIYIYYL